MQPLLRNILLLSSFAFVGMASYRYISEAQTAGNPLIRQTVLNYIASTHCNPLLLNAPVIVDKIAGSINQYKGKADLQIYIADSSDVVRVSARRRHGEWETVAFEIKHK